MELRWLDGATLDVDSIGAYIAGHNPYAARKLVERIRAAARQLATSPYIGRPGRNEGTREWVVTGTPYIIAYRVHEAAVEIAAVVHGARDWPDAF
jgi:toxin ParE1/3/4